MQQYSVNTLMMSGELIPITKEQTRRICRVIRVQQRDVTRIADNSSHILLVEMEYRQEGATAQVVRGVRDYSQTSVELTLAQGMTKEEKWDCLLQKSAELGVAEIIPFVSSRCAIEIKDEKSERKIIRQNKVLCGAYEQYKRSTLVRLQPPYTFPQLSQIDADLRLIAYEDADCKSERLCGVLRAHPPPKCVPMVVGSEDGFSADEIEALTVIGLHRVSLDGRILRAETTATSLLDSTEFYCDVTDEKDGDNI